jgi:hypothetical protein
LILGGDATGNSAPAGPSSGPIAKVLRAQYLAARTKRHKLEDDNVFEPDNRGWARLVSWVEYYAQRLARPGEAREAAQARIATDAVWLWLTTFAGRRNKLNEERHPFAWILHDLDNLALALTTNEQQRDAIKRAKAEEKESDTAPEGWDREANLRAAREAMAAYSRRLEQGPAAVPGEAAA